MDLEPVLIFKGYVGECERSCDCREWWGFFSSSELQPWPAGQTGLVCAHAADVYVGADEGTALSEVACVGSHVKGCVNACNVSLWNTSSTLLLAEPANLNNSSCIGQAGMERPARSKCATGPAVSAEKEEWGLEHAGGSNSRNIINRHRLPRKCTTKF